MVLAVRSRLLPLACFVLALVARAPTPAAAQAAGAAQPDVRALWMASLPSADRIPSAVRAARTAGFNTIIVDAGSPASLVARDAAPIDAFIRASHEAGLRVHLSLDVLRAVGPREIPAARDHVLYRHPEWLMVPRPLAPVVLRVDARSPEYVGRLMRHAREHGGSVYATPLQVASAAAIVARVGEIAARYAVDGVHLAGLALPGTDYDYSPLTIEEFRAEARRTLTPTEARAIDEREAIDPFAYPVALPGPWRAFRAERLSALAATLRGAIRAARPDAMVSLAVVIGADAPTVSGQDWPAWLARGFADTACASLDGSDTRALEAALAAVRAAAAPRPFWVRLAADGLSPAEARDRMGAAGRSGAAGVIVSSASLAGPISEDHSLIELGRALQRSPRP